MLTPFSGHSSPDDNPRLSGEEERLMSVQALIHPGGDEVSFVMRFGNRQPIRVRVAFEALAPMLHEFRTAAFTMMNLQATRLDRGESMLEQILRHALSPADIRISIEPVTAHRLFLFQFLDHAPLAIRQCPVQFMDTKRRLASAEAATLN